MDAELLEIIKSELLELPQELKKEEIAIFANSQAVEKKRVAMGNVETETRRDVMYDSEKEDLKKSLSNTEKREFAVTERLNINTKYQDLRKEVEILLKEIKEGEINYAHKRRQFRSAVALAHLFSSIKDDEVK